MPLGTVLVVEDEPAIRRGLCDCLRFAGYQVREAGDGRAGLDAALGQGVDLVLLDILMPHLDGLAVLTELRRIRPALPVIFLTARGEEEDRIRGLRAGADDYIVKPFSAREVLARVEAVLRRSPARPSGIPSLCIDGRTVDFERREIIHDGHPPTRVPMTQREAEVLSYLACNRGKAVSRDELLSTVWGVDPRGVQTRTIDMAIARLRELLRDDPAREGRGGAHRFILTVRGKGYMLAPPPHPDDAALSLPSPPAEPRP